MTAGTIGYVQLSQFLVVYGGILPLTIKYVLEESYEFFAVIVRLIPPYFTNVFIKAAIKNLRRNA